MRPLPTARHYFVRLYRLMARKTIDLGVKKGSLAEDEAQHLLDLLESPEFPPDSMPLPPEDEG